MQYIIYNDYLKEHWFKFFLFFVLITGLLTFVNSYVLMNDELFYQFYEKEISYKTIQKFINNQNRWGWVVYPIMPVLYMGKFFLVTCMIMSGVFLAGYKTDFFQVFKAVIISEFIFIIPLIIKLIWFGFFFHDYNLQDIQYFSPLSVSGLLEIQALPTWIIPLTMSLSLFELGYWLLLAWGTSIVINKPFGRSLQLVVLSYGAAWLLFQVLIIFITINMS